MAMRGVTPIAASDIDVADGSYLRRVLGQVWQELPLLMVGALFPALACLPPALLLLSGLPLPAALAALLGAVPAWTAYCHLGSRIAVQRSTGLGVLPAAFGAMYGRSVLLPALPLALAWLLAGARAPAGAGAAAVLVTAGETVALLVLLAGACAAVQALALVAAFDLPLRQAAANSLLILLAKPWLVLGLASLAYLLAAAAWRIGPAGWLLALGVYTVFQVNATLLVSKQLLDAQQGRAAAHINREEGSSEHYRCTDR
jgi:hypothetical protein